MPYSVEESVDAALAANLGPEHYKVAFGAVSDDMAHNWYDFLTELRGKHGDIFRTDGGKVGDLDLTAFYKSDKARPIFVALSFDAISEVVKNASGAFGQALGPQLRDLMGEVPLVLDPPEHTPYRALVTSALSRPEIIRLENELIEPATKELVRRMKAGKQSADLVAEFTGLLPFLVVANLMDLPPQDCAMLMEQAENMLSHSKPEELQKDASRQLGAYFGDLYDRRIASSGRDVISALAHAEIDGTRLTRDQVIGLCRLLFPGGIETTAKTLGHLLATLLLQPDQWQALKADPPLVGAAVEEILRYEAPITFMPKLARSATQVAGMDVPEGAIVFVFHGGFAGRDPSRWKDPNRFDLTRPRKAHVAFGGGPHFCPGSSLARKQLEIALQTLLRDMPDLRLDPTAAPPKIVGARQRSVNSIRVCF